MEFIKQTELFFIQLQYCLGIEPEPILQTEKGYFSFSLKPDIFLKLINDFQIEYPFIPENKIIELKGLMSKENINTKDALEIIDNYKKQYWFVNTVIMFEPVTDKLKRTLKSIDSNISEKEIHFELIDYYKHLQAKRESIYLNLINDIQGLPPQHAEKEKPEQEAPKTFDELFYNIELVQQSIDVLKEIEPPLIDTDYNFIGKLKGIICVWIDELQRQGIVKHYSDRKIFASLIPQKIKRFSIDESMFGKYHNKAEKNYRTDIKTKVSKIKLSQNSQ